MRIRSAGSVTLCALCWLVASVQAGAVKLEHNVKPGTQMRYDITGSMKQKMSSPAGEMSGSATLSGDSRRVVVEADAKTGEMLLAVLARIEMDVKMSTPQGEQSMKQEQVMAKVLRADRTGKAVVRESKDDESKPGFGRMFLMQIEEKTHSVVLPDKEVKPGDTWESETALGLLGIPLTSKMTATLAEMKDVDGAPCAVIKVKLSPSEADEDSPLAAMKLTGDIEFLFDTARGIVIENKSVLKMEIDSPGGGGDVDLEMSSRLTAMETLPQDKLAACAAVARALDAAVSHVYADELDKAMESVEKIKTDALDEDWKKGVSKALTLVKQIQSFSSGAAFTVNDDEDEDAGPEEVLMREARAAAKAGDWQDAASTYEEVAEEYPDHALARQALAEAAAIYEKQLKDPKKAEATRGKLLALQEKRAGGEAADPLEIYRLAGEYARAGKNEEAVTAYGKFLAVEAEGVPGNMKVLAQYRMAGLLEKLGRRADAAAAYGAVEKLAADDDYSKKLKERAAKKAAELSGAPK